MGKRSKKSSMNSNHKIETFMEDRISQLPEDILGSILSRFTIIEAARTSVLSHKWNDLWTFNTHLNFDSSKTKWEIKLNPKLLERQRKKFARWVNQVVDSHRGLDLDEFRVCFDLDRDYDHHVDKWISFAMRKRVKELEIDLKGFVGAHLNQYAFPLDCYDFITSPLGLSSIKFLRSFCLKFVNITNKVIEHLLSNCPLLEQLSIHSSDHLSNLKVVGPSLKLKYFEVLNCSLKSIEICAPNLVSFYYRGEEISLQVQDLHSLVDLTIGAPPFYRIDYAYIQFSSYFPQLETLKLDICPDQRNMNFSRFPELTNLKHLIFRVLIYKHDSLLRLSQLIKLSPFLHKFTLELLYSCIGPAEQRVIKNSIKCPHQNLKVVEMIGFVGHSVDVELIMFFLENAINLEKIIIDPRNPIMLKHPKEFHRREKLQDARNRAEKLKTEVPSGVELLIL